MASGTRAALRVVLVVAGFVIGSDFAVAQFPPSHVPPPSSIPDPSTPRRGDRIPAFLQFPQPGNNPARRASFQTDGHKPGPFDWMMTTETTTQSVYERQAAAARSAKSHRPWWQAWKQRDANEPKPKRPSLSQLSPHYVPSSKKAGADPNDSTPGPFSKWPHSLRDAASRGWHHLRHPFPEDDQRH